MTARVIPIRITTSLGIIDATLDSARARTPAPVTNFLRYIDGDCFKSGRFHRTLANQPKNAV